MLAHLLILLIRDTVLDDENFSRGNSTHDRAGRYISKYHCTRNDHLLPWPVIGVVSNGGIRNLAKMIQGDS